MQNSEVVASRSALSAIRSRAAAYARQYRLDRAIRAAREISPATPPDDVLSEICETWGDSSLSAFDGFLRAALLEAQKANGHILQCGADLTTLLLAIQLERRDVRLWTIESSPHAANVVRTWLGQYELAHAHVITAPANMTAEGAGYILDTARLPGPLGLVLCDASGASPGNARRLLPAIEENLHGTAVMLVRNVRRRTDLDHLTGWARDNQASFVVKGKTDPFAKIVMRDPTPVDNHQAARINTAFAQRK